MEVAASERESERERERERARASERGTPILESLQRRAFYPRPRRPHAAFRPRSSSAHPDAHHPRPASIRPPTPLPPPGRPPAAAAPDGNPAMQASTRPRPHPARADTAHTPMHATRNRPTGPAHAAAPAAGIPDVGLKGASGPATGIDRPCTESSAGARGASDEERGSSSSIVLCLRSFTVLFF